MKEILNQLRPEMISDTALNGQDAIDKILDSQARGQPLYNLIFLDL
jgi:hypothetical protein